MPSHCGPDSKPPSLDSPDPKVLPGSTVELEGKITPSWIHDGKYMSCSNISRDFSLFSVKKVIRGTFLPHMIELCDTIDAKVYRDIKWYQSIPSFGIVGIDYAV